jgi:ATP-binding cassette subfamily A (ABC1) protein 3
MVRCAECDAIIDNQCAAHILYHVCDSTLILSAGVAAFMTVNILTIPRLELQNVAEVLDWIFLVFPHYSLSASINNMYNNYAFNKACSSLLEFEGVCIRPNACCKGK